MPLPKSEFFVTQSIKIPRPSDQKELLVQLLESLYDVKNLTDEKDDKKGLWRFYYTNIDIVSYIVVDEKQKDELSAALTLYRSLKKE